MRPFAALLIALTLNTPLTAQTRIASDFEIAQMKQQLARSKDFLSQLSARLNLGDAYLSRNEPAVARGEFMAARSLAANERVVARTASDITRYATATVYEALAGAKLGEGFEAFELLEEAVRYASDSAKTWNLYSSAMTILRQPAKAASAARNAVAIATAEAGRSGDVPTLLDLAIYQYALASALIENGQDAEAEELLRTAARSLQSRTFGDLKRSAAASESFEIYSTARGEEAAYLSILNRTQLRLGALLERKGDVAGAREQYKRVLDTRTDDATALAALARLGSSSERESQYSAAFEANPFAMTLIRDYQQYLKTAQRADVDGSTIGARVRRVLVQTARGETRAARAGLATLIAENPNNETLKTLLRETATSAAGPAELRELLTLITSDRLTPEQRAELESRTFIQTATFDEARAVGDSGQTVLESGTIEGLRFRFPEPTAFRGTFTAAVPVRLTFRVLGATDVRGADGLLLEPLGLEHLP